MKAAVRLLFILALVAPSFASAQTPPPAPTCTLKASAATVAPNTKVRLDWTSNNASAGYLNEVGPIPSAGFAYVVPGKNTTYAASFTGPGGSIVCRVGVAVSAPATGGGGGTVNTGGGTTNQPATAPNTSAPTGQSGLGLTSPTGNGFVGGIVPAECRGKSTIANCDLCSLAQMIQNLSNFMLGLSVPAAAILFAIAGIRLFGAGGVPERIKDAKKIFKTVLIGFLIIVSVWALVNTAMNMLMKGGDLGQWNWSTLDCRVYRAARLYNMSIKDYLNTSLPTLSGYTNVAPILNGGSAFGTQCPYGGSMSVLDTGNTCTAPGGYSYPAQTTPVGGCAIGGEATAEGFCVRASDGFVYSPVNTSVGSGASGGGISGGGGAGVNSGGFTSCASGYSYTSDEGGYCQSTDPTTPDAWTEACPTGYVFTANEGGYCEDPKNPNRWVEVDGTGGSGASQTAGSRSARAAEFNNQLSVACAQQGLDCNIPNRLGMNESSGGRNCTTSTTGAAGCMQVLATTACGVDSSISDACAACSASRQSLSSQCAPVIQAIRENQQMGVNLGVQYIANLQNMPALQRYQSQYGECQVTAAAYYAGPGATLDAFRAGGNISNIRVPAGAQSASSYVATACR